MSSDVITVRVRKGRRRHALPQSGGAERMRTLCGREAARCTIDDAFPDCKPCLKEIVRLNATVIR